MASQSRHVLRSVHVDATVAIANVAAIICAQLVLRFRCSQKSTSTRIVGAAATENRSEPCGSAMCGLWLRSHNCYGSIEGHETSSAGVRTGVPVMADVPLYDRTYARFGLPARQQVRHETYGEDLGQNSWLTVDEWNAMIGWITPRHRSRVLDVGCGSGGPDLYLAQQTGAQIVGIDMNADAVSTANAAAAESGLASLASFQQADASTALPFADGSFDAVFCIDAVNHLRNRLRVFQEWHRVLKPHGQVVFTDPVVVTGLLTNEEIAARTSIGIFVLSLLEEDNRLLDQAGFDLLRSDDSTDNVATVARRWLEARAVRRQELEEDEGPTAFEGMQQFLTIVHTLAAERRLSRYTFLARVR